MKRLKTFLLAAAGLLLALPSASAQNLTAIGSVVDPANLKDGMEVVFSTRSGNTSKGHYLTTDVHFPPSGENPAFAFEGIYNVPEKMKFRLVKSETQNVVTGDDQWYIQSVETGKYLTFEWNWTNKANGAVYPDDADRWINMYDNGVQVWVDDTTQAKAFVLHCNEYDHSNGDANGDYGSKSYGSSTANWEAGTYTVVYIFDNSDGHYTNTQHDGGGYGRVFLANEFEVSSFNIRWYSQYQDTNVWDIRELIDPDADPQVTLAAYADNLPATIAEDYMVSTTGNEDPGFVPEDALSEFTDAYNDAISGEANTAELAKAAVDRLDKAYQALKASKYQVKDGGYYYIKTAYDAFTTAGNGEYAWVAPYTSQYAGWTAFKENDNQFIWQAKLLPTPDTDSTAQSTKVTGRMYYTFQNVGSGVYLGNAAAHDNSQPILFTSNDSNRIALIDLGQGEWNISSKYDYYDVYPPRPYHMEDHASGAGTQGRLVLWAGDVNTASAWYIRVVPDDQVAGITDPSRQSVDNLRKAVVEYSGITDGAVVGDGLGQPHSQAELDNLNEALRVANKFVSGDSVGTAEELAAAGTNLQTLGAQFRTAINAVPDGYYRIRGNYQPYRKNDNDIYFALYNDTLPGWKHYQKTTEQLWKITNVEGGFTIQNVKNGMYINKAAASSNGSLVDMTKEPETTQLISMITPNGQMGIYNVVDSTFGYDPSGHSNGAGEQGRLQLWSPRSENGGTSWSIYPVSDADAQALIAGEADNELNLNLKAKVEEARATYNANTDYTIGDQIITSADQIYVNNWSPNEGTNIGAMIDGDKNSYWNSTWEGGAEQDPNNPHYIRIYDATGLPDSVQVQWVMRQNGTWHREAVKMRVQVSNDAENWTSLYELYPADVTLNGKFNLQQQLSDSVHYVVNGLKGYQYVRFITEVNRHSDGGVYLANNHMMIEYAEYNLFPITGVSASSNSQLPTHKAAADELYAALQEAQPQYMNGTATQATYDRLVAALDAFNALSKADNTLLRAQYNLTNLTAGDRIGEFPEADLNTYKQTIQTVGGPILEKINSNTAVSESELNDAVSKLNDAYSTLIKTMVKPTRNAWYTIEAADESRSGYLIGPGGVNTHAHGSGYSYWLTPDQPNAADGDYDSWNVWTLNEDENGRFVAQNAGTGGYFGPLTGSGNTTYNYRPIVWYVPNALEIVPLGDGQIALANSEGYYVQGNASWYARGLAWIQAGASDVAKGSKYAWKLNAVSDVYDEDVTESPWYLSSLPEGRAIAITLPYTIKNNITFGEDKSPITAYTLVGKIADEKDSLATAYKFKAVDGDVIPAGTPTVYVMPGEYQRNTEEISRGAVRVNPAFNTELAAEPDTVNGLVGTLAAFPTTGTIGRFNSDSIAVLTNNTVEAQRGFLVPSLVKNIDGSDDDDVYIIYVEGAGIVNGINSSKIVAVKHIVNVYTVGGVLLRKGVDAATATDGLTKGIYIVGKKKVLVK